MVIDSNNIEDIVNSLSPIERAILYELGKMDISVNKNVNEETIKKKLSNDMHKGFSKAIRNLKNRGLIVVYRPKNYGVPQEGRIIIKHIVDKRRKDTYKNLRILMINKL